MTFHDFIGKSVRMEKSQATFHISTYMSCVTSYFVMKLDYIVNVAEVNMTVRVFHFYVLTKKKKKKSLGVGWNPSL